MLENRVGEAFDASQECTPGPDHFAQLTYLAVRASGSPLEVALKVGATPREVYLWMAARYLPCGQRLAVIADQLRYLAQGSAA